GSFSSCRISCRRVRKSVIVEAKKKNKVDSQSFVAKPDEATGPFPEALLLKEKKVEKMENFFLSLQMLKKVKLGEIKLSEFLNLQLEGDQNLERMRHYEVVYLIHEKHFEEVESVNTKVQGNIYISISISQERRKLNDWGMRRVAYNIKKATNANYIFDEL
ncbi:hypothetical protein RJ641_004411, partial [Dillenia turbinata]